MTRDAANAEIIAYLIKYFANYPYMRFFQGLQALGIQKGEWNEDSSSMVIKDNFYEESEKTLENLKQKWNG